MSQPPHRIAQWLSQRYPRPKVDPEWLQGCYQWLMDQPGADDSSQKFLDDVEAQLLQSDLTDSMLEGTGLPIHITEVDHREANTRLTGSPVLVEIVAITEIASSAYQLDQIRVVREERTRLGQTDDDGEGEGDLEIEGEGPMPKYPRGMLRFQLSDGSTTLSAVEYRSLPELILGKTPLGFKMLLRNPMMRRGIAFLEPNTVTLIGYQTVDRETLQSIDFARGLRVRMGLPIEPAGPEINENNVQPQPMVAAQPNTRAPLREISPPPEQPHPAYNDDENLEPRRRKVPLSTNSTVTPTQTSSAPSATLVPSSSATVTSQYFSNSGASTSTKELKGFNLGLTTAQVSQAPRQGRDDDEDGEDLFEHFDNIDFFEGDVENDENAPPPKPPVATTSLISLSNDKASRPLVPEDSIEIVSFTSSQLSQPKIKEKGKSKEKEPRPSAPLITTAGKSTDFELDPDILGHLDKIDAERFTDPDFLRQQEEEMAHIAQTQAQNRSGVSPGPSITQMASVGQGKGKEKRIVRPLPKTRAPLFLNSQSRSPQPQASSSSPLPSQPKVIAPKKEVIEIDSSSSSSSSPRFVHVRKIEEDGIELLENDDDIYEDGDKENVPVMTRHVRRKITNGEGGSLAGELFGRSQGSAKGGTGTSDVIELSDEDWL